MPIRPDRLRSHSEQRPPRGKARLQSLPVLSLLALETSADRGSVALLVGGETMQQQSPAGVPHSAWILPAIEQLLAAAGRSLAALDAIAFGSGPGSFTGVRLACGIAQGLALGLDRPVVAICSLEAMAAACAAPRIWVGIDARMHEMYYAGYAVAGERVETLIDPACAAPEWVPEPPGEGWLGVGSAFSAYREILVPRLAAHCRRFDAGVGASAEYVARLAGQRLARGESSDPALVAPLYVRDKVALTTKERLARGGRA